MNERVVGMLAERLGSNAESAVRLGRPSTSRPSPNCSRAKPSTRSCSTCSTERSTSPAPCGSISSVALAGKPTIVRVPVGEFALASRLLDAGASGILAPMINSGEDARRLVEFVKFPPLGQRSWGPRAALTLSGLDGPAYLKAANAMTQAIAMIETRAALDALDEILGVEGVDGVFVGPSDLSIALSGGLSDRAARPGAHDRSAARRRAGQGAREIRGDVLLRRRGRPRDARARLPAVHDRQRPGLAARGGAARARGGARRRTRKDPRRRFKKPGSTPICWKGVDAPRNPGISAPVRTCIGGAYGVK